jgi:hypothetical protein
MLLLLLLDMTVKHSEPVTRPTLHKQTQRDSEKTNAIPAGTSLAWARTAVILLRDHPCCCCWARSPQPDLCCVSCIFEVK